MHVAIGSENPVKTDAVERVLPDAQTTAVGVDSAVPEQPWGREETVEGARNRADAALAATDADYGVGIEGGVVERDVPGGVWLVMWAAVTDRTDTHFGAGPSIRLPDTVAERDSPGGVWLVMWAAVTDGTTTHFGAGPSIRLPESVAQQLREGEELGPLLDDELGREDIATQEGAIGVYTDGRVGRTDALEDAVAGAFGPFLRASGDGRYVDK